MKPATWYYDIISPFAYLQAHALPALADRLDITARPILFAGLLKHWGQLGPAELPTKRDFTYRSVLWRARQRGLPYRMPPAHPFNPLGALRLLAALPPTLANATAALGFVWGQGNAVDTPEGVAALAHHLGAGAMPADAGKDALRAATDAAIGAGAFGVPTLVLDTHIFWGDDSTGMVQSYLDDPDDYLGGEAARIATLPHAATRPRPN